MDKDEIRYYTKITNPEVANLDVVLKNTQTLPKNGIPVLLCECIFPLEEWSQKKKKFNSIQLVYP